MNDKKAATAITPATPVPSGVMGGGHIVRTSRSTHYSHEFVCMCARDQGLTVEEYFDKWAREGQIPLISYARALSEAFAPPEVRRAQPQVHDFPAV